MVPGRDWDFSLSQMTEVDSGTYPASYQKDTKCGQSPDCFTIVGTGGQQDNLFTFKPIKTIFIDCPIVSRIEEYI